MSDSDRVGLGCCGGVVLVSRQGVLTYCSPRPMQDIDDNEHNNVGYGCWPAVGSEVTLRAEEPSRISYGGVWGLGDTPGLPIILSDT